MTICAAIADEKWDRWTEGLLFGCFVDILIFLIIYGAWVVWKITIKELYEYANANGFENLPLQYGFVDDNGIYYPDYLRFADFDYNIDNVTMMFYVAGDKEAKGLQKNTGSTMEYVGAGDDAAMGVYKCSQCGSEVQNYEYYDFCPWCGNKIKGWE